METQVTGEEQAPEGRMQHHRVGHFKVLDPKFIQKSLKSWPLPCISVFLA